MNEKIASIQSVLGVKPDGLWGTKSQAALDALLNSALLPPVYAAGVVIGTIEGCDILRTDLPETVVFVAKAAIDCDGGNNPEHDPCWRADTTLHHNDHAIDAETVPYVVTPPLIIAKTHGIVLGCKARVTNTRTGQSAVAVVADIGPRRKLGEISPALARLIGVNPNPNHGGEDSHVIRYEFFPGVPAVVNGVTYGLRAW